MPEIPLLELGVLRRWLGPPAEGFHIVEVHELADAVAELRQPLGEVGEAHDQMMQEVEADGHQQAVVEPGGLGGQFAVGARYGGAHPSRVVLRPEPQRLCVGGVQLADDPQRTGEDRGDARLLGRGQPLPGARPARSRTNSAATPSSSSQPMAGSSPWKETRPARGRPESDVDETGAVPPGRDG